MRERERILRIAPGARPVDAAGYCREPPGEFMNSELRCKSLCALVLAFLLPAQPAAAQQTPSRAIAQERQRQQKAEQFQSDKKHILAEEKQAELRRRAERDVEAQIRPSSRASADSASEEKTATGAASATASGSGATGVSGAEREGVRDPCLTKPTLPHCK